MSRIYDTCFWLFWDCRLRIFLCRESSLLRIGRTLHLKFINRAMTKISIKKFPCNLALKEAFHDLMIYFSNHCILFWRYTIFFLIWSFIFFTKSLSWYFDKFRVLDKLLTNAEFRFHDPKISLSSWFFMIWLLI